MKARVERRLPILIGLLFSLYLLQTASPLRLDHDSVLYLRMAIGIADQAPVSIPDFPLGYPAFIALLDMAGLRSPPWFVLLNCVAIGAGLLAIWTMPGRWSRRARAWTIALTLLSYPVVRSVAMPLSEAIFFGLSLLAVAAMTVAEDEDSRYRVLHLVAAAGLTAVAISVRLIGIALLPALCFTLFRLATRRGSPLTSAAGVAVCIAGAGVLATLAGHDSLQRYRDTAFTLWSSGSIVTLFVDRTWVMLSNLGEIALNLPVPRFRYLGPWLPIIGLAVAQPLLAGAIRARRLSPLGMYVAGSIAILFLWPFHSVRLWAPIIPAIILFAAHLAERIPLALTGRDPLLARASAGILGAWLVWFLVTGFAAIAWTTRISLSGERFATLYGANGGFSTPGFETANREHDDNARIVLERYDARQAALRFGSADSAGHGSSAR